MPCDSGALQAGRAGLLALRDDDLTPHLTRSSSSAGPARRRRFHRERPLRRHRRHRPGRRRRCLRLELAAAHHAALQRCRVRGAELRRRGTVTSTGRPAYRVTPNVFGTSFGVCGLAQAWSTAHAVSGIPRWPADTLWIIGACLWLATLIWYATNVIRGGRLRTEVADPVFAPFTALIVIVPMLFGIALGAHARAAGEL